MWVETQKTDLGTTVHILDGLFRIPPGGVFELRREPNGVVVAQMSGQGDSWSRPLDKQE